MGLIVSMKKVMISYQLSLLPYIKIKNRDSVLFRSKTVSNSKSTLYEFTGD